MNDLERTVAVSANGAEATLLGTTVTCPVCGTENAPNEKYCGECGFLLSSTPGEAAPVVEASEQARLVDVSGQREYPLHEGENTVGREATDILLGDPSVSRRHALIILDAGKCSIEDVGSTNGTYVGGKQIQAGERVELADGVELKFGSAVVLLKMPPAPEAAEPSEAGEAVEAPAEEIAVEEVESEAEEVAEVAGVPETEEPEEAVTPEVAPVARLVSTTDPSREFAVVSGSNTIGRGAGNDIVLSDDPYVSGSHAELIADERGFWLMDVGSTNGTTLNGSRIEANSRMALSDGDEIVFGQTTVRLEIPGQEADEPPGE